MRTTSGNSYTPEPETINPSTTIYFLWRYAKSHGSDYGSMKQFCGRVNHQSRLAFVKPMFF